jgi:BirA family biotin operon repressor/biotin-[acetyl-CoA-carboxylase] ligase
LAAFTLGRDAAGAGCRLLARDEAASTSALALDLARGGERGPLWVVAARQTAGHGRRGRAWQSPAGNLAASFLMVTDATPAGVGTLGFAAGLAVHAAIAAVAPALAKMVALKWPNDVLANGAKVAGVLVETEAAAQDDGAARDSFPPCGGGLGRGVGPKLGICGEAATPRPVARDAGDSTSPAGGKVRRVAVIGFGVNVAAAPAALPYPATSLAALGAKVTSEALFAMLSDAWLPLLARWREGGFAVLRRDWLDRAMGLGGPLATTLRGAAIGGIFETIDDAGRLVMRGGDGARRTIAAGEVHFGDAATARAGEGG